MHLFFWKFYDFLTDFKKMENNLFEGGIQDVKNRRKKVQKK